ANELREDGGRHRLEVVVRANLLGQSEVAQRRLTVEAVEHRWTLEDAERVQEVALVGADAIRGFERPEPCVGLSTDAGKKLGLVEFLRTPLDVPLRRQR